MKLSRFVFSGLFLACLFSSVSFAYHGNDIYRQGQVRNKDFRFARLNPKEIEDQAPEFAKDKHKRFGPHWDAYVVYVKSVTPFILSDLSKKKMYHGEAIKFCNELGEQYELPSQDQLNYFQQARDIQYARDRGRAKEIRGKDDLAKLKEKIWSQNKHSGRSSFFGPEKKYVRCVVQVDIDTYYPDSNPDSYSDSDSYSD